MHNAITKQAAQKVISKIDVMGEIALFKAGHASWEVTRTNTDSFKNKLRLRPDNFMGIYNLDARLEDIMDDLFLIGIK